MERITVGHIHPFPRKIINYKPAPPIIGGTYTNTKQITDIRDNRFNGAWKLHIFHKSLL